MKEDPKCLQMIYMLPKTSQNCDLFQNSLTTLASLYGNNEITFRQGFSQKIEERRSIGEVAAILGSLSWKVDSELEDFDFILADMEKSPYQSFYSTQKV